MRVIPQDDEGVSPSEAKPFRPRYAQISSGQPAEGGEACYDGYSNVSLSPSARRGGWVERAPKGNDMSREISMDEVLSTPESGWIEVKLHKGINNFVEVRGEVRAAHSS